jgi:hypothetical protein
MKVKLAQGMRRLIMEMPGVKADITSRTTSAAAAAGPDAESTVIQGRTRPRGSVSMYMSDDKDRAKLLSALDAAR